MSEEVSSIIEKAGPLSIKERVNEGVYKEAARWLRNDLPTGVKPDLSTVPIEEVEEYIKKLYQKTWPPV